MINLPFLLNHKRIIFFLLATLLLSYEKDERGRMERERLVKIIKSRLKGKELLTFLNKGNETKISSGREHQFNLLNCCAI